MAGVVNPFQLGALDDRRILATQMTDEPGGDQLILDGVKPGRTLGMLRTHFVQQAVVVSYESRIQDAIPRRPRRPAVGRAMGARRSSVARACARSDRELGLRMRHDSRWYRRKSWHAATVARRDRKPIRPRREGSSGSRRIDHTSERLR